VFIGGMLAALLVLDLGARNFEGGSLYWLAALLVFLLGLSSLTYFALMRACGARARWRSKWFVGVGPALVTGWSEEDHGFTTRQYAVLGTTPVLLTLVAGIAFVALTPVGVASGAYLLVVYGLAQLKSVWLTLIVLRQPEGTSVEERADGTRICQPSRWA